MNKDIIISQTEQFVKKELELAESGHDWWHIFRVWNLARFIAVREDADHFVVSLGALLHDIADSKFFNGDENTGPEKAREFLSALEVDNQTIEKVLFIIKHISFKNENEKPEKTSLEFKVVQDADRLDAIGVIGIARAFSYGGFKKRPFYHPDIPPKPDQTKEEYKKSTAPTINHFYEKLLLLKDKMNTSTGQAVAQKRHKLMEDFLASFFGEWNGEDYQ